MASTKRARKAALTPNETGPNTGEIQWNPGQYVSFPGVSDGTPSSRQSHAGNQPPIAKTGQTDSNSGTVPFALIILNQPIEMPVERFTNLWEQSDIVVCADGGANRLLAFCDEAGTWFIPSVIAGDFDSIEDEVSSFFQEGFDGFEVDFRQDEDQYSTDFDKAVDVVKQYETKNKMKELLPIVALGAFAGRVDQSFSLLHQLFKCIPRQLYLLSPRNVSFLLPPGRNHILASAEIFGPCCGVIPVSGPATITLEGFRWNLENFVTELGGTISTSNEIDGDDCVVTTDKPVLWTIEFRKHFYEGQSSPPGQGRYYRKRTRCTAP